jgi:small subunit ribosomal protein S27Ae
MGKKRRPKERKGKMKRKPKKQYKLNKFYEIKEGKVARKSKFCPKCGDGTFLAEHKDRVYCGKCGYTEMKKK